MNHSRILLLAALAAVGACQPKTAVTTGDTSPPVAKVNGSSISRDFYEFYIKGITGKASSELTPQQRDLALDNLIRARLVGEQAVKEGLDKGSDTAALLELSRLNVLQQAVSDRYLKDRKPSEQELRAEYETQLADMPKQESHARHILVATEPFAEKIVTRLDKGEKFDALAKQESMDSSKGNGGDLGWFTPDRMVPQIPRRLDAPKTGEIPSKADPDAVRLARHPAARYARADTAAVRPGAPAPRAGRAEQEVPWLFRRADARRQDPEAPRQAGRRSGRGRAHHCT